MKKHGLKKLGVMVAALSRGVSPTLIIMMTSFQAFADGTAPALPAGGAGAATTAVDGASGLLASPLVPMVLMFGVMYFLMIRPQQKKLKQQQEMLNKLQEGDDIVTSSGILGKITSVNDKLVTVEIADKVKVRLLKSQVAQVVKGGQVPELAQAQ